MKRWEYLVEKWESYNEASLNAMGNLGWELVYMSVFHKGSYAINDCIVTLVFKREIEKVMKTDIRDIEINPNWDEDTKETHNTLCILKEIEENYKDINKEARKGD